MRKRVMAFFVLVMMAMGMVAGSAPAGPMGPPDFFTICHVARGNPDGVATLEVPGPALPAHLAHGDTLGPCAS